MGPDLMCRRVICALVVAICVLAVGYVFWQLVTDSAMPSREEPLGSALGSVIDGSDHDRAMVAKSIWDNFRESRTAAVLWSGVYWGFTFGAALLSAIAGVVLKLEWLVKHEAFKKDAAAVLSVVAALLITISSSGDFQRKWQANRIAAAQLESTGYELLSHDNGGAHAYLAKVGEIVLQRNLAIAGDGRKNDHPGDGGK